MAILEVKNLEKHFGATQVLRDISFELDAEESTITITAEVGCTGETGVEMEALTAASVAALTVYDMCKAVQRDIRIGDICLLYKSGGKSGEYKREDAENG